MAAAFESKRREIERGKESAMAAMSWCLTAAASPLAHPSSAGKDLGRRQRPDVPVAACSGGGVLCGGAVLLVRPALVGGRGQRRKGRRTWSGAVVCMAPEEEKMTRRSPLDFPIEWERPKPGRRPDIFPQFSPMKTPLPPPLPADPPEEDEEEEEKKEEEEDPEKEEEENPDKPQSRMRQTFHDGHSKSKKAR